MENAVIKRLRYFIKSKEITVKYFSEIIDTPEGTFKSLFQRDSDPSTELIIKILNKYPNLSANWLLMGFGEMESPDQPQIGKNALSAANALLRLTDDLNKAKEIEKKVPKTTQELINKIVELTKENSILEQKLKTYENNTTAAQPPEKYGNK